MNSRDALEFLGILSMGTCTLVFAALWWTAFLTGHEIYMTIARYGERYPEAALWFLIGPLMLYAIHSYLHRVPSG